MKHFYFLIFGIFFFSVSNAQIINFPDANFKAKLLQPGVAYNWNLETSVTIDANNDGEIEFSEIQSVSHLNISNANISDLTGISNFTNLRVLDCSNNLLQQIVIGSSNVALKNLKCNNNLLQNITIDHSVTLTILDASHNQLTAGAIDVLYVYGFDDFDEYVPIVDFSYNNLNAFTANSYYSLNCSHNPLTTFDLNGASIKYLDVGFTSLSSFIGTGTLKQANFQNCQFTLLDLTNVSFYYSWRRGSIIFLGNNLVDKVIFGDNSPDNLTYSSTNTFLDLINYRGSNGCSYYPGMESSGNIQIVDCPNLNFIGLKNGYNYGYITCNETTSGETWTQSTLHLQITNCPSLSFMCVDEGEQAHIQEKINALGLQNQVQVNSYCSFTPGGTFYTINGLTKFDANNDGCDMADEGVSNFKFSVTNGTSSGEIISNDSGNYSMPLEAGTYTITPLLENAAYFNVSPPTLVVAFPATSSPVTQNFCITPNGIHNDLEITIIPVNNARPGFDAIYKILYKNKGNQTQSGDINFTFDDAILDFVNANPTIASQVTNALTWSFINLAPFESREILVTLNVNSPMEVPPVNGDDILNYNVTVNSSQTDETPADNAFSIVQTVVNSFDPNDKTCLEGNTITPEMIGKDVHYMIRFENTGTANAENIVVKDMIDTTKFDVASLIPIDGSHPFVTKISNTNKVEFIFENINLPFDDANNDGYVAFKIKTKPTLVLGDTFSNTASIYFDYNFPIITNNATTTVAALANQDFVFQNYINVYPNPAHAVLNIDLKKNIAVTSLNIYNTLGQLVLVIPNADKVKTIDISSLKTGNYFLKVNSDQGSANMKFIKQ